MELHDAGVFRVLVKEGTHLASSTTEAGLNVGAVLNNMTNTPDGLAILERIDIEDLVDAKGDGSVDPKMLIGMAIGAAIVLAGTAVYQNRSRITTWWNDKLVPVVASRLGMTRSSPSESFDVVAAVSATKISAAAFSTEVREAIDEARPAMSSIEARRRLVTALLAAAVAAEELRVLRSHHIIDDEDLRELRTAMQQLTHENVVDRVNHCLASGEVELDDHSRETLVTLFRGGSVRGGKYMLITPERVAEALYLVEEVPDETGKTAV